MATTAIRTRIPRSSCTSPLLGAPERSTPRPRHGATFQRAHRVALISVRSSRHNSRLSPPVPVPHAGEHMPVRNEAAVLAASLLLLGAIVASAGVAAAQPDRRAVRIGFVLDGPWDRNDEILALMRGEISALVGAEFDVQFPDDRRLVADWTSAGAARALDELLRDPAVDLVIALGILASDRACRGGAPAKPVIAPVVIDAAIQGLPGRDGTSGVHNLTYLSVPSAVDRD